MIQKMQVLPTRQRPQTPLLNEPPLGYLEALVCMLIKKIGPEQASGLPIVRELAALGGLQWLDPAQTYLVLTRLKGKKCIEKARTIRQARGAPMKTYVLTDTGAAMLKRTIAHYRAVLTTLETGEMKMRETTQPQDVGGSDESQKPVPKRPDSKRP